jgi:hypothetical protein
MYLIHTMPSENGDYLSRFERVERNLEVLTEVLTNDVVTLASVVNKQNESILAIRDSVLGLHQTIDALHVLIDRIPPQSFR